MFEDIILDGTALQRDLENYFGSALMGTGSPQALMELERVRRASDDELIQIAEKNGFCLMDYKIR